MTKRPTYNPVTDKDANANEINSALDSVVAAFDNTLSLDGSTPNAMDADLDMNSNDIINVGSILVNGEDVTGAALRVNNLSDLEDVSEGRTNLGVEIGVDVQAHSTVLDNTTASFTIADETKLDGIDSGFVVSLDASSDASLDFTAFDSTKYDGYFVFLQNLVPATDNTRLRCRTSADGVTFDTGASDYVDLTTTQSYINVSTGGVSNTGAGVSGMIVLAGPHLSLDTFISGYVTSEDTSGNTDGRNITGRRDSAAAVQGFQLFFSAGNITSGTMTVIGLRNS